jgi:hypothetical protein
LENRNIPGAVADNANLPVSSVVASSEPSATRTPGIGRPPRSATDPSNINAGRVVEVVEVVVVLVELEVVVD